MDLPRPPDQYDTEDQAQTRRLVELADGDNLKKKVPIVSFVMKSPDGSKFTISVSNAGALVVTPL